MLACRSYAVDTDGNENLKDRRKLFSVAAIRLCNALSKVRQQDKYCSSYRIKKRANNK